MAAVAVVVEGVGIAYILGVAVVAIFVRIFAVGEIEAVQVVDEAVAVVIDPIPVRAVDDPVSVEIFAGVDPDVAGDVRVFVVETGIDHGDDDTCASGDFPGLGRPYAVEGPEILEGLSPRSTGVEEGVVREIVRRVVMVALRVFHMRISAVEGQRLVEGLAFLDLYSVDVGEVRDPVRGCWESAAAATPRWSDPSR